MKIIRDLTLIEEAKQYLDVSSHFSTPNLPFCIIRYEKGEFLTDPIRELKYFLMIWKGSVSIYYLQADARFIPVGLIGPKSLIGDVEFVSNSNILFGEAGSTVFCLALPITECRAQLQKDLLFLTTLTQSLAQKVYFNSNSEVPALSVEQKVLHLIHHLSPNQTLTDIGESAIKLRCSRRQLQRVLSELCRDGQLEKIKKGTYRLKNSSDL